MGQILEFSMTIIDDSMVVTSIVVVYDCNEHTSIIIEHNYCFIKNQLCADVVTFIYLIPF